MVAAVVAVSNSGRCKQQQQQQQQQQRQQKRQLALIESHHAVPAWRRGIWQLPCSIFDHSMDTML
jgi:hypothetical protein